MPSAHIPRCHFPVVLEHPQGWWLHYSPLLPKQPVHYCWHKSGCCWSSWAYCWLIVSSCRPTLSAPFFSLCSFPATQPQPSHILSCKKSIRTTESNLWLHHSGSNLNFINTWVLAACLQLRTSSWTLCMQLGPDWPLQPLQARSALWMVMLHLILN